MPNRDEYFRLYYRTWGAGRTTADKIAHWREIGAKYVNEKERALNDEEVLLAYEKRHLERLGLDLYDSGDEPEKGYWPTEYDIFKEKFYFERGVVPLKKGRLWFFQKMYASTAEGNSLPGDMEKQLAWFEQAVIMDLFEVYQAEVGELKLE